MKKIILASSISLFLNHFELYAQAPGSLDNSFDIDGKVTTAIGSSDDEPGSVAIQSDGKIIVVGFSDNGTNADFAVIRYNTDGSLDNSFDGDGILTMDFASSDDGAASADLQSDGKIVVAGYSSGDFAVARYNSDGSLDITFDSDGKVTTDFGSIYDGGSSMVLQSDGKIVVAGVSYGSDFDFALVRYNSDGSLDNSFSGDGKLTTDFWGAGDAGYSVVLQPDGKIIVAGTTGILAVPDFAMARYNSDGSLDITFDGDGKLTTDFGADQDIGNSVILQPDGKIIMTGPSIDGVIADFVLVRYNSNGSLDTSFDVDGKLTTDFAGANDQSEAVILQSDGKIIVVGYSSNGGPSTDFALARYNSDGSLDTAFDIDGKLTTDFASSVDIGLSVALQPDGKIVVAGYTDNGANYDFAVARYISGLNLGIINFSLDNNSVLIYPNPIAQDSKLKYILNSQEEISISLLDISGQMIKTFVNCEKQEVGPHSQMLNMPVDLSPGNYYIILSTPNGKVSVKVMK